jgi:anti-anti-sigma factor
VEVLNKMSTGTSLLKLEEHKLYSVIRLDAGLEKLSWSDLEDGFADIIRRFEAGTVCHLMLDLSHTHYINSGVIAGLVRVWKSCQKKQGQFSVVSPNELVTTVLRTSGLGKVWSITHDREEGAYALGVSQTALVEHRERTLLVFVALPCALLAAMALIPLFLQRPLIGGINAHLAALLLAAAGMATGTIGVVRERGIRWKLSLFSLVLSLVVLSTMWLRDGRFNAFRLTPGQNTQQQKKTATK